MEKINFVLMTPGLDKDNRLTPDCPRCVELYNAGKIPIEHVSWLHPMPGVAPLSKRDNKPICHACSKAEDMAAFNGLPFAMMRTAVEEYRQEAIRLPHGFPSWGHQIWGWPTGGLDEYLEGLALRGRFPEGEKPTEWKRSASDAWD